MNIKDNIGKISWSFGTKVIFMFWGVVTIIIANNTDPSNYSLYFQFTSIIAYLSTVSDSFSLQGLIQFGNNKSERPKINFIGLSLHFFFLFIIPVLLFLLRHQIAHWFDAPNFVNTAYFIPVVSFFVIPRTFIFKILARDINFKKIFFLDSSNFGIMSLVVFYFIYSKGFISYDDLVLTFFLGAFVSGVFSTIVILRNVQFSFSGYFSYKKYLKFTVPWTINSIFFALFKNLDIVIIALAIRSKEGLLISGLYALAKNLFRVFEQLSEAAGNLIYPSTVKNIDNPVAIKKIMTKGISFMFVFNLLVVIILQLGLAEFFIENLLPVKYNNAIIHFKFLIIGALFLPFTSLLGVLTALEEIKKVILIDFIAAVISLISLYLIVNYGYYDFVSFGLVINYFVIGLLSYLFIKAKIGFKINELFRAFSDTKNFLQTFKNK